MDSVCLERNGKLIIVDVWQWHYSEPVMFRMGWPTGIRATEYPHFINMPARIVSYGLFEIAGQYVSLENREKTKGFVYDEKPLKKPRWAKSYQHGEWKRY